jgi:hypothetical protein
VIFLPPSRKCRLLSKFKAQPFTFTYYNIRPPLWSSVQSSWLLTQRSWARFLALPDFLCSSGSGTGVHSALVRVNEELLERKVAAAV